MTSQVISCAPLPVDMHAMLPGLSYFEPKREPLTRAELLQGVTSAEALITLLNVRVDEELLGAAPKLKIVANYAVGYDNVDMAAASRLGVVVTNTPDVLTNATADFAFALILAATRRLGEGERLVRAGKWKGWAPDLLLGGELHGRTLGVVGAGRIGCGVLQRAKGFGMKLLYTGTRPVKTANTMGASFVDVDTLFEQSDVLSLHCPLNKGTRNLVNARRLGLMKRSAVLVNTARGACVDHEALADAIETDRLAAAALDVFDSEPIVPTRLMRSERIVLAPHLGSATIDARSKMAIICAEAISSTLAGRCPVTALNPEVLV